MVKSNSCSSRLELTGTTLDEQALRNVRETMASIQNQNSVKTSDNDAEESVRTLVNRLENCTTGQKCVPRIIESKCIEKIADTIKPSEMNGNGNCVGDDGGGSVIRPQTSVLINNQSIDITKANQRQRLPPVDLITQVTVNNHINFNVTALDDSMHNHRPIIINTGDTSKVKQTKPSTAAVVTNNDTKPISTTNNNQQVTANSKSIKTKTNTISFEKIKQNNCTTNGTPLMGNHTNGDKEILSQTTNDDKNIEDNQIISELAPRLVKWDTLSRFDEKNYVTNDAKLKQKPKYDDIEFEEFEVYDPNHECYDSLNSK